MALFSAAPSGVRLPEAELREYEAAIRRESTVCDVPPIFRVRMQCNDAADEADLLSFLRRDGVFAYPVPGGVEALTPADSRLDAPRELIGRLVDWFSASDAALNIWLS